MTTQMIADCRALIAGGRLDEALARLEALHRQEPDNPDVCHYLGLCLHLSGRSADALPFFEQAVTLSPGQAGVHQNMALALMAVQAPEEAAGHARQAIELEPESVGARLNLVLALTALNRWEEARSICREALDLRPDDPAALGQMGVILMELGEWEAGEAHLRQAIALRPEVESFYNLGVLLQKSQRIEEAIGAYGEALRLDPLHERSANNLAACFRLKGELSLAERVLNRLIEARPEPVHRFNRACLRLLAGRWTEAWAEYELRAEATGIPFPAALSESPRWQGENLGEGTLVILHEQGLGDSLQFVRLLPRIAGRAGKIIFICQPQLLRLLSSLSIFQDETGPFQLLPHGANWPAADAWLPLLSLPGVLNLSPDTVSEKTPYLKAEASVVDRWQDWLDGLEAEDAPRRLRIGLSWQGNPKAYGEPGRSLPLSAFAPLAGFSEEIRWVALQKGEALDQVSGQALPLCVPETFDDGPDAFIDTAALILSLDLVITSDTAVAHLAGALGRPVWLLLRKAPDWRWGMEGLLTDWYPTLRLFRQTVPGDWAGVMQAVQQELKALLAAPKLADIDPSAPETTLNEAIRLHQARDFSAAVRLYRHLLAVRFEEARVLNLLGMAFMEAGGRSASAARQALPFSARSVALRPDVPDHWSNFAIALDAAGHGPDGLRALRHALTFHPDHVPSHLALARRETAQGRAEDALHRAGQVVKAYPNFAHGLSIFAGAALALGRFDEAEEAMRRACRIEPASAAHLVQLGAILLKKKAPQEAARAWEKALVLEPGNADAWSNLGVAERNHGLAEIAAFFQKRGTEMQPNHAEAWSNLGISLLDAGYEGEARDAFTKAIAIRPHYADAEMALGMALMNEGRLEEGLPLYERRFQVETLGIDRSRVRLPEWQGEDLTGKSILVLAEQGFGDAFQFVRYVRLLKQRGAARIMVGCRRKIAVLMASMDGVDGIVCENDPVPPLDYHIFMMSLPLRFGTRVQTIPAFPAYLAAEPECVTRWAEWLSQKPGFRVGLVWQGNPDPQVDKGRSYPLRVLAPLARIEGVRLIALQKGAGEEQIEEVSFAVERPPEGFDEGPDAFVDTAALIMNLDLVITSDTAVAHLAGALGKPVWVILKSHAEWRWLRGRSDSPWYPRSRLFRRVEGEQEAEPFAGPAHRVAEALKRLVAGDRAMLFVTEEPVVEVQPRSEPQKRLALAIQAHMAGDTVKAEAAYAALLHEEAVRAEALHMLGGLAIEQLNYPRALLFLEAARSLGLATPAFQTNFSIVLRHLGRIDEAEGLLRQSLASSPSAEAFMTLGNLLRDTDRHEEALEAYDASLALRSDLAKTHRGKGNALREMGRPEEAVACLTRALELEPEDAETLIDRAHAHLMAGHLPQGFADYEARWRGAELVARSLPMPRWDGAVTPGARLLIHGEQGLGDQIQFARFLRPAISRVGFVILEVREPLVGLFALLTRGWPNIDIRRQGIDPVDDADLEIPMLSLPLVLGTTLESLPAPAMFRPDPRRVAAWEARFAHRESLRVGLVWQGNPNARADKGRSPPLKALELLFKVEGVHWVALQFKDGLEQVKGLDFAAAMELPGRDLGDFAETAAAISALDLVISSCTSTLHLAASLGVPTFALLKYGADWRWMAGRQDSPWYPGLRLFRQSRAGDWAGVAEAAAAELRYFTGARHDG
ncbi:tetratricopeptide repeat protein [Rhizobium paknamense]|uniref:Tetratricopeptide (TPR) repeat protein n=1 Tax=Rhizobium paknamense TaxID=1206817 RepID=A0ABU0ID53_9HYPH|nr:tetratricopeptide repeat protein [Rhizobium paknamense]MDQ0456178.1 tetratricopeptide (TPR) repeat protein [Rhizobium paknamense]